MGANVRKRKQLRKKSKNKGRLKFKCKATKRSWTRGQNVHKNLRAIGLTGDPNNIHRERRNRYNKVRIMVTGRGKQMSQKALERKKENDKFDYNPMDLNNFLNEDKREDGSVKTMRRANGMKLSLPKSALAQRLNTALNHEPGNLFVALPRHKREYYQRLIARHGNDISAMHNDVKLNFFQWTENRIRKDLKHFQYEFRWPKQRKVVML